ncbi:type II secretion system protein N [Oceaniovalibus sp. ACAM 378]|uniref:type II secretion system protein N n=1 Tax=Oceaniovalibus sp. ACAM 378 TaxID=2599923 RepID=UPI0011D80289|nr:type II secretion system protein N [Oceaniovalibus sp. ACAM 378]TYB83782.1 hypothetical protein FQ320_23960 [Oceaniovalibus sp. ACAM 378]
MKHLARILFAVVTLFVVGFVAIAAGRTFWHVAGESAAMPADRAVTARPDTAPDPVDLTAVIALRPFGSAAPPQAADASTTATTLNLSLRGVVLQAEPAQSYALIADGGKTASYSPGDTIAGRAVLLEVAERHVVLNVDGARQTLSFPNSALPVAGEATAEPVPTPLSNMDRLRAALGVGSGSTELKDPPPPETTEEYIDMWRTRIIRNPNQVLGEIGLIATEKGYIVGENPDPGVKLAGLRAGDRVAKVNGQAVGNVEQDRKFFDEVAASGVARLEVVREGTAFVMSFPLR